MGSVVARFEVGPCAAMVWANAVSREGREVTLYNVSVCRNYRDRAGQVQSTGTGSLRPQDLPAAMLALGRAYAYLLEVRTAEASSGPEAAERAG